MTTVIWLMARYYGYRRISRVLGVFLVGTIVATVYLGWHFFVDDLAGPGHRLARLLARQGHGVSAPARAVISCSGR